MHGIGFDQTIRNFTSGDLGISLVVIQLRVTRLKKKIGRRNWCYSREWMYNSREKICCITPGE